MGQKGEDVKKLNPEELRWEWSDRSASHRIAPRPPPSIVLRKGQTSYSDGCSCADLIAGKTAFI